MSLIYVAHPIDQHNEPRGGPIGYSSAKLAHHAQNLGHSLFWPSRPWTFNGTIPVEAIAAVNQVAHQHASAVVALLPAGRATLGVPVEIEQALREGKPVAIVTDLDPRESVQLAQWVRDGARFGPEEQGALLWLDDRLRGEWPPFRGIKVKSLNRSSYVEPPRKQHADDAGYDLEVSRTTTIEPRSFEDIHCDLAIELPPGYWGLLVGRSSTIRTKGLMVTQGIIDGGYRGELFAGCWNLTDEPVKVETGERLAQLIPLPLADLPVAFVDELGASSRGADGFGSSGR